MSGRSSSEEEADKFVQVRGPADVQRLRLERLMANPDKPAHIPDSPKDKPPPPPAEYVRFYMGSSAGAGSGEFHIYRNLRRKEQNRMKYIEDQAKKDKLQSDFDVKHDQVKRVADQRTARNRAKRLKQKTKKKGKTPKVKADTQQSSESESSSDEEEYAQKCACESTTVLSTVIPAVAESSSLVNEKSLEMTTVGAVASLSIPVPHNSADTLVSDSEAKA